MKNNKSNVNKQHNKKLLVEVVILMAILFINVILINGAAIFFVFYQGLISNLEEIIPDYYEKITDTHLSNDSYEFMVDYYTNNAVDIDMNKLDLSEPRGEFDAEGQSGDLSAGAWLSRKEIEALDEKKKRSYALYCYAICASYEEGAADSLDIDEFTVYHKSPDGTDKVFLNIFDSPEEDDYIYTEAPCITERGLLFEKDADIEDRLFKRRIIRGEENNKIFLAISIPVDIGEEDSGVIVIKKDLSETNEDLWDVIKRTEILTFQSLIVVAAVILFVLYNIVVRPLIHIQKSVRVYRDDKDSDRIVKAMGKIYSENEIGILSDDLSDLAIELERYAGEMEKMTRHEERMNAELSVAERIQSHMLPKADPAFPERDDFRLYASYKPARRVGGDFYDFFFADEEHLVLVMGDVSGKGIPASLFMVITKNLIMERALNSNNMNPGEILEDVNALLIRNNPDLMFVTVWLGILNVSTGELRSANAGHEFPLICRKGEDFAIKTEERGIALGIYEKGHYDYEKNSCILRKGDRLFVYTDGVTDAADKAEWRFGQERLEKCLNGYSGNDVADVLPGIQKTIDDFASGVEQFDDITMMIVEL